MKAFGFKLRSEKKFIHLTCNIILSLMVCVIFCLSVFMPLDSAIEVSSKNGAYYYGNKNSQNVSLMINVYWGSEYLSSMLETLKENNVKVTFFVGGQWVAKNYELLNKMVEDGHEIGNHGYNHKDHDKISNDISKKEIKTNEELVFNTCGVKMNLFAPPSGSVNKNVVDLAESLGYKTIMWSRDTIDWRDKDENLIYSRAVENTEGGDFILMHPTLCTSNALKRIILSLKDRGFNLTTVSDNLQSSLN